MTRGRPAATVPPRMGRELRELAGDRVRGARALALAASRTLAAEYPRWRRLEPSQLRRELLAAATALEATQPAMGPFLRWGRSLRALARPSPAPALAPRLARFLARERSALGREPARLQAEVRRRLPPRLRILTISRSESVIRSLLSLPAAQRPREVRALVSLPGGEGRATVRELRRGGLTARPVADRDGPREVRACDLVLVGADAVDAQGTLVHKVGTFGLARAAAQYRRPVVVLAGRSKWVPARLSRHPLPAAFDRTPRRLITAYWTDRGELRGGRKYSGGLARR